MSFLAACFPSITSAAIYLPPSSSDDFNFLPAPRKGGSPVQPAAFLPPSLLPPPSYTDAALKAISLTAQQAIDKASDGLRTVSLEIHGHPVRRPSLRSRASFAFALLRLSRIVIGSDAGTRLQGVPRLQDDRQVPPLAGVQGHLPCVRAGDGVRGGLRREEKGGGGEDGGVSVGDVSGRAKR